MISGELLQKLLIAEYALIAIVYAFEGNIPKACYFVSAGAITLSVIFMK